MKLIVMALMLLLIGNGCAAETVWETVEDTLPAQRVQVWQAEAYTIEAAIPTGAVFVGSDQEGSLYATEDGKLEVRTAVFLSSDLNSAVKHLSGLRADKLTIVQTTRFGLPEYQFAWYAASEQGGRLCHADLVMDGAHCYALVTSVAEEENKEYREVCRQLFSSFGLRFNEGV